MGTKNKILVSVFVFLLKKELHYCNINIEKIKKQALSVYKLGNNENTRKKYNICDFKKIKKMFRIFRLKKY